jgi:two-component system, OmpR family, osmolarity sensor histidine kinase EnvZ
LRRWFDTLFARLLLLQAAVALLVLVLFAVFAMRQQWQSLARVTAPLWAAALVPALQGGTPLPRAEVVTSTVQLLPGPPPPDAAWLPVYAQYQALADELRARGVPVRSQLISGRTGDTIVWLEIEQGAQTRWVGVHGEFQGTDLRERSTAGFVIGIAAILLAVWWLARRFVRPLEDLRRAIRRFDAEGRLPEPVAASAPVELRELAQQFSELARQRLALDEQRRTMLAAISHDLRSPLGRIRLAAELLPEAPGMDARRDTIVRNVQVADRLLGSFIDMARAEDEPIRGRVDLCALLRDVAAVEADVSLAAMPAMPLCLQPASAVALERALHNLLDNARHHGAPPFEMALRREGHQAVLSVRDHGPGIAAEAQAVMLQPFTRGEASRHTPGTGLGLAIVQRTAARHGGSLQLSDASPGLRAELRLPLEPG